MDQDLVNIHFMIEMLEQLQLIQWKVDMIEQEEVKILDPVNTTQVLKLQKKA